MPLPVSERGNDQPVCTAQVLIAVAKLNVCDLDHTLVGVLQEVEAGLLLPLKVSRRPDVHSHLRDIGMWTMSRCTVSR